MITSAEIIEQPLSGEYVEKIYDIEHFWKSSSWSWIKFCESDDSEWVGSFRGDPINVAISDKHKVILVLTTDCLFQIDILSAEMIKYNDHMSYFQCLTLTPKKDFIISDYTGIYKIENDIDVMSELNIPSSISLVDYIKLNQWKGNRLQFTCEEPTRDVCYLCKME